jgi:hypothetical protein
MNWQQNFPFPTTSKWLAIFYYPQHAHVFLPLNNSLGNKWFNFKIPYWSICTIIPFSTCFLTRNLRPIMFEFYHVLALKWAFGFQCPPFMLYPWQWMHGNPLCSLWHFCCHCMGSPFLCGMKTTTHTSFNHVPLLSTLCSPKMEFTP